MTGPLTRIQIDCGSGNNSNHTGTLFSGLRIGKSREISTGAEKELLLSNGNDQERRNEREPSRIDNTLRYAPCLLYIFCAIFLVTITVVVILGYTELRQLVDSIDSTVSLRARTVNMIQNADAILNQSAQFTSLARQVGAATLNTIQATNIHANSILNVTVSTLNDVHRLVQHPTIQIGGR